MSVFSHVLMNLSIYVLKALKPAQFLALLKHSVGMSMEPESWEDFEDTSSKMSSLSINANSFVPNATAAAFVPRFSQETSDNFSQPPHTQQPLQTNGHVHQPTEITELVFAISIYIIYIFITCYISHVIYKYILYI